MSIVLPVMCLGFAVLVELYGISTRIKRSLRAIWPFKKSRHETSDSGYNIYGRDAPTVGTHAEYL